MLPELILREEKHHNLPLLVLLGAASAVLGYTAASILFPSQLDIMAVVFGSIPLIYPLTEFFLDREKKHRPHIPEIEVYSAVFLGQVAAFFFLNLVGVKFELQRKLLGLTGAAISEASFLGILGNNMIVFAGILFVAALIGSAGAFILSWNASVLGIFLSSLFSENVLHPLAYVPHASLEMAGFIVAGVSGTMISAAVYREHFSSETWKDLGKLVLLGVLLILLAAVLETA